MNIYTKFRQLLPRQPLLLGSVAALHSDGTITVTLITGGDVKVIGQGVTVSDRVYIQGHELIGKAPTMPFYEEEIF